MSKYQGKLGVRKERVVDGQGSTVGRGKGKKKYVGNVDATPRGARIERNKVHDILGCPARIKVVVAACNKSYIFEFL